MCAQEQERLRAVAESKLQAHREALETKQKILDQLDGSVHIHVHVR